MRVTLEERKESAEVRKMLALEPVSFINHNYQGQAEMDIKMAWFGSRAVKPWK